MTRYMIPYGRQCIEEDDIEAVAQVLRSDFLTTGPKIPEFEAALCALTGARHAVVCSNGTTALHLALIAAGIGPGDAAIVPSMTFLATANAVRYCGADVVFADVDADTGLMEAHHLERALARAKDLSLNVKAVLPVHLTGRCVDMRALKPLAERHNLKMIADCAHAVGSAHHGTPAGSGLYEDFATFSFHPVKTIAAGEGGAVTTNNAEHAAQMRIIRSHGMAPAPQNGPWAYDMQELGYNYRMTDLQCALALSQLKKIDRFIQRRAEIVALYDRLFADLPSPFQRPALCCTDCVPAWHLYAPRIDFTALGMSRADFVLRLREKGVGTQVHYIPVHTQPYYKNLYGDIALPGANQYYERTLSLPLFPLMRDEDAEYVVQTIKDVIGA
ncbi:MAG: UDP-4-amino-4,6-dideoxy-N-acetyl-beta-L-altrosamine transaminase [Alphaproteobacteria bacterium]|nr:UDP-4-amino-4,6-dideoxy-N-acetyl-beta-L-altrosamine transaminase [Alphaproteobacteria bacterium]